jgi:transposase-like protein
MCVKCVVNDELLDALIQKRRKKAAAFKLLRKLLKRRGVHPETIGPDTLATYARRGQGSPSHQPPPLRRDARNNRVENSQLVILRRERRRQKFKPQGSGQRLPASDSAVQNTFITQAHLISRASLRILCAQAARVWEASAVATWFKRRVGASPAELTSLISTNKT